MKKYLIPVLFIFIINTANAQTTGEKSSHYKAAEEMLSAMGIEKMTSEVMDQMLDLQIKSNPMLESKRGVMQAFFTKHLSWASLKDDYIKIYQNEFTESELKDLTAFYHTPTGKKLAEKSGVLAVKGSHLGQQRVQEHIRELQEMLMKE